jgi:hypothetical protein
MDIEKSLKIIQASIKRRLSSTRRTNSRSSSKRTDSKSPSKTTNSRSSSKRTNSTSSNRSSKTVFISETIDSEDDNFKNAIKISRFLRSKLIIDKYSLDNRVQFLNYITNKLKDIRDDDCLEKKEFANSKGYTIRNIINLEKLISKDNFNGNIYKTSLINTFGVFPIATKVMKTTKDNLFEISLMNNITEEIIQKKISKHFLIIYRSCICKKSNVSEKSSLISVNEIANGDLASLLNNPDIISNNNLLYNILFQTLISIGTFHNLLSLIHNDCHGGNFLWHYNNEKGYYHYIFNGKSIYLKACKYNIMIYDFGLVEKINNDNSLKIIKDYCEIIPAFLNENYDSDENDYSPNMDFALEMNNILTLLMNKFKTYKEDKSNIQADIFIFLLENVFKKNAGNIFKNKLTKSMKIINKTPYYINNI